MILFPAFVQLPLGKLINVSKPQLSHLFNWEFLFLSVDETIKWNILYKALIVPKGQYSDSDDYLATLVIHESLRQNLVKCWERGNWVKRIKRYKHPLNPGTSLVV